MTSISYFNAILIVFYQYLTTLSTLNKEIIVIIIIIIIIIIITITLIIIIQFNIVKLNDKNALIKIKIQEKSIP